MTVPSQDSGGNHIKEHTGGSRMKCGVWEQERTRVGLLVSPISNWIHLPTDTFEFSAGSFKKSIDTLEVRAGSFKSPI